MESAFSHLSVLNFAVVVPMANEESEFDSFIRALSTILSTIGSGKVYLVIDKVSTDSTLSLARELSSQDPRFQVVFAPENKNVVDAYIRGYREAYNNGHDFVVEMDAGLSHDPNALPRFLEPLSQGKECVFGGRFMKGGSMDNAGFKRVFLSRFGTFLSNVLLGSKLKDMTSGYQGFDRSTVKGFLDYDLLSTGHFYQTEMRYLLRCKKQVEIPIRYTTPSPSISNSSVKNSLSVLMHYFRLRLAGKAASIE